MFLYSHQLDISQNQNEFYEKQVQKELPACVKKKFDLIYSISKDLLFLIGYIPP